MAPSVTSDRRLKRSLSEQSGQVQTSSLTIAVENDPERTFASYAIENAIGQAKKTLIQDHLDNCLEDGGYPRGILRW